MTKFKEIIAGKVYTREGTATSGEKIYIGIEKIEKGVNLTEWQVYLQQTIGKKDFYFLSYFTSEDFISTLPESITGYKTDSKEFNDLCDSLSNYCQKKTEEQLLKLSSGIGGASANWHVNNEGYLCYISKAPITGHYKHPIMEEIITIKGYHEGYKDLVMTVQSKPIENTVVFNNRGIFKHLDAIIEGGYVRLSMDLHKAAGEYFEQYHGKTHMTVSPLPTMFKIMKKALGETNVLTKDQIPPELNHFAGSTGILDKDCVVSIKTLSAYGQDTTTIPEDTQAPSVGSVADLIGVTDGKEGVKDDEESLSVGSVANLIGENGNTDTTETTDY